MNKLIGKALKLLTCFLCLAALTFLPTAGKIYAEEENQFRVQTTATDQTDTVRVTVYLNNAKDVGAIDVTLSYDPERVSFVESSLGETLNSVYSDIYHDESAHTIHYLILYMVNVDADGILLTADFELLSGTSYQPELIVNQLVDGNTYGNMEYTVSYLHSDGIWADTPDPGEEPADAQDAEDALNAYGSEEDVENGGVATGTVTLSSDNKVSGNSDTVETATTAGSSQTAGEDESQTTRTASETEESTTKNDSSSNSGEATDATTVSGDSSAGGNTYDDTETDESGEGTLDEGETGGESEELTTLDSAGSANTDGEEGENEAGTIDDTNEKTDTDENTETNDSENDSHASKNSVRVVFLVIAVMIIVMVAAAVITYIVLQNRTKKNNSVKENSDTLESAEKEENV